MATDQELRCVISYVMDQVRDRDAEIARLTADRDAAIARAERAEMVAVWAYKNGRPCGEHPRWILLDGVWVGCDGTDADLYRALVEACEGGRECSACKQWLNPCDHSCGSIEYESGRCFCFCGAEWIEDEEAPGLRAVEEG